MPSPASLAEQGLKALNSQDYAQAINLYTQALKQTPESPDYYIKRSTAFQRSSDYARALEDAEKAVVLAHKRGKRELISSAQLRRGISLLMDGRIGDAGFCFEEAERKVVGEKEKNVIGVWKKKLELQLAKIDGDDVRLEVTVSEIPDVTFAAPKSEEEAKPSSSEAALSSPPPIAAAAPAPPAGVTTPVSRIRHEWYQTAAHVVLTVYVKGVPKDKATIEIDKNSVAIAFPLPTGSEFTFDVCPLYDEVDPAKSSFSILSTKIEVKLAKGAAGRKWADLEAPEQTPAAGDSAPAPEVKAEQPAYPTSSKTGPKDWDKVAKELTSRPKKTGKKGAEGGGSGEEQQELESDDEGGDPVSHFFKKLYKDADEDTRRAMMKSYVESNGTALSTNWKEVGKAPVETSPPAGMIAKNWDS